MKWCPGMVAVLIVMISASVHAQEYGGKRLAYSGYRYQEAESVPPADVAPTPAPAPSTRVRKTMPDEGAYMQMPGVVHDDYGSGCNSCGNQGMLWRRPSFSWSSGCCARPPACGCESMDGCGAPSCCTPGLLERLHCQCQTRWSAVTCRVRGWNMWGNCDTCGQSTMWGGCGCQSGGVMHERSKDPLMPQALPPMPDPQEAPGPVGEPEAAGKAARRNVPSTVVPSAAWKWSPIRSSF